MPFSPAPPQFPPPAPLVAEARSSFAVAIHAGGSTGAHARTAFVDGIHTGLLYAAAAAVVAAISVAVLLRSTDNVGTNGSEFEQQQHELDYAAQ